MVREEEGKSVTFALRRKVRTLVWRRTVDDSRAACIENTWEGGRVQG